MISCIKDRSKLIFNDSVTRKTATFDLADMSCYNHTGRQIKSLNSFFVNKYFDDIAWEDKNYEKFVMSVKRGNRRLRNIGSMLNLLHEYRHNEGYILLGLPISGKATTPISDYPKAVRKFLVNKFAEQNRRLNRYGYYSNQEYSFRNWSNWLSDNGIEKLHLIQLLNQYEDIEELIDIELSNTRTIFQLVTDYNMDMKSLIRQIIEYMRREGLTMENILRNLLDYNRMSKTMGVKYQKYPKYLLSTHQIVIRNYNAFREEYEESAFMNMVNKSLAHKGVTYSVLAPEKSQDIKDEGAQQHHCVASYVKSVIEGKTQIVFMRSNKALDKPLITIEVKDGQVYQAKGSYNRQPSEDELKFIKTYANQKDLTISKYL